MSEFPEGAAWAIFLLPVASLATIALFTRTRPKWSGYVGIAAVAGSFILSLFALNAVVDHDGHPLAYTSHEWVTLRSFGVDLTIRLGLRLDGLTAVMLVVVTSVSLLVQIYSQGYMEHDPGYTRYFAYLSLFTASMLGLVLVDSVLFIYVFWELVGLSSYLLIGFWFHKPSAADAAKKAFLVTRLGDLGFLLAVLLIWVKAGTFDIAEIHQLAVAGALSANVLTLFALGLFAGAVGKSAQFPLHVWLPDAMEGPTPVSALIHAATMVAAGVYLVARFFPVYHVAEDAMTAVAIVGSITAVLAATMGLVVTDIKRVMAYSTISQLGYMMLALGVGGYVAAIFHLFTHAFFKALLFLGAGSVNHATNTFDMRKMGGLARAMPVTYATLMVASLSLVGVFPFAGFWSKDEILTDAWHEEKAVFFAALAVVFLTAVYTFRMMLLTFHGEYRGGEPAEAGHGAGHGQPGEPGLTMLVPLAALALPAFAAGFANAPGAKAIEFLLEGALPEGVELHAAGFNFGVAISSTALALAGIGVAWAIYAARIVSAESIRSALAPVHAVIERKYYLDDLYERVIVARGVYGMLARALATFDERVVDGAVNGVAELARSFGSGVRQLQTGQMQAYGVLALVGLLIGVAVMLATTG